MLIESIEKHFLAILGVKPYFDPTMVAALLRVEWVTAGLAESNGSLPSGL